MIKRIFYIFTAVIAILAVLMVIYTISPIDYSSSDYRWQAELTSPGKDLLVRGRKIDRINSDINKLIYAINQSDQDPEIFRNGETKIALDPPKLKLIEVKGGVVVVEVINADYLTQRMGSAGAAAFLAEATFTLTEFDGIKYVHFDFPEGDHAAPGLYSREDFYPQWEIIDK